MPNFLIIPGVFVGIWVMCKMIGAIGLIISDLWNTFVRR